MYFSCKEMNSSISARNTQEGSTSRSLHMKPTPLCTGILLPSAPSQTSRHILHWHILSQRGPAKSWRDGHNYCTERFKYILQRNLSAANPGSYINNPNFHVHIHQGLKNYPFFSKFKTNTPISRSSERRNERCLLIRCQGYLRKERKNIIVETKVAHYILPSESTRALNTWNQLNCVVTLWKAVNYLNWAVWQRGIKMRQGQNSSGINWERRGYISKEREFSFLPAFLLPHSPAITRAQRDSRGIFH